MKLDLIIRGNIITVASHQPRAEAVGIVSEKIVAVGTWKDVAADVGTATRVMDLTGKTILPGFIDNHAHLMRTGKNRLSVDLSPAGTVREATESIKQKVMKTPPGSLIFCTDYNRQRVAEKRYPTKQELDTLSDQHLIWIQHYDGHDSQLNSLAVETFQFKAGTEGVELDSNGEVTGLITDPAIGSLISAGDNYSDPGQAKEALLVATHEAAAAGITTVFAKEGLENAEFIMNNVSELPVRIHPMVFLGFGAASLDEALNSKLLGTPICICNLTDGSIESRTAAMYEPYADDPANLGILHYTDEELYAFVEKAHRAGCQISLHAEADRAIDQALRVYEKVLENYPRQDHRHRIEHFEVATHRQINHVARLGITLAMQPMFITVCEGPNLDYYRSLLGEERIKRGHMFRSILNKVILVSGGSDSPVTKMNPLAGIQACVNHPLKEQRIDVYEAIEMFTINGAKTGFEEDKKGSIEVGKLADFVVLSDDPYRVPKGTIGAIKVETTIVGGKTVYQREQI